jgi:hypothetical protein
MTSTKLKTCYTCNTSKPLSEFNKCSSRGDGLQGNCKVCDRERVSADYYSKNRRAACTLRTKQRRQECKQIVDDIKAHCCCAKCKESSAFCLDFHHLSNKDESISYLLSVKSKQRLLQEIRKCIVLCSNCHRKVHARLYEMQKLEIQFSKEKIAECMKANPDWLKRKIRNSSIVPTSQGRAPVSRGS